MAYQSGKAPATKKPIRDVVDNVPAEMSRTGPGRAADRTSHYGRGGYSGPSSLAPFERTQSAGAKLGLAQNPDADLERVKDGHIGVPDQLRDIGAKNVPINRGTRGASPGPKVPDKLGTSDSKPVRKP